jgi:hypothetical protein
MTPARAAQILVDAGEIPPARQSSAERLLAAAMAADAIGLDLDELEQPHDTEPPTCAPTLPPPDADHR